MHPIWMFLPRTDFACHLMQVLTLPAKRGFQWLAEGMAIFRMKPALLVFVALGCGLTMVVISAIPYLGQAISLLLIPAFSVSLMNACRIIDRKEVPPPLLLFSGFHRNMQTLFTLGMVYLISILIVFVIASFFDGGHLLRMFVFAEALNPKTLEDTSVLIARQLSAILLIPVMMAFWFAPVLAAWHDMSAGKSLFFSLVACVRNWRAFLVYVLAMIIALVFMLFAVGFISLATGGGEALSKVFSVIFSLVFLPTIYASYYASYRDVFAKQRDEA